MSLNINLLKNKTLQNGMNEINFIIRMFTYAITYRELNYYNFDHFHLKNLKKVVPY